MKPNTMFMAVYEVKEKKTYMINTTTRKIYSHGHKSVNTNFIAGCSVLFVTAIIPMIHNWLAARGLDNLEVSTKVLLVIAGVLIGIITFMVTKEKRRFLQFEEFMKQYPESEEVNDVDKQKKILSDISDRVELTTYSTRAFMIIGIALFALFIYNSNVIVYGCGVLFLVMAGYFTTYSEEITFLSKIKEVGDIADTDEVKTDKNENDKDPGEQEMKDGDMARGAADFINWNKLSK